MARRSNRNARKGSKQIAARNSEVSDSPGYGASRYNATRHGIFSQSKVLKWEDEEEFNALEQDFINEYQPVGVTERELTEDLAWITWRKKMRLRPAENAAINDGLREAVEQGNRTANATIAYTGKRVRVDGEVFETSFNIPPEMLDHDFEEFHEIFMGTMKTVHTLEFAARKGFGNHKESVDEVLEKLPEIYRDEIEVAREDGRIVPENEDSLAAALASFIGTTFYPRLSDFFATLQIREGVTAQAIGSAMFSDELPKIVRYEAHLDRKFEKTLAMLMRLQEIRERREAKKAS